MTLQSRSDVAKAVAALSAGSPRKVLETLSDSPLIDEPAALPANAVSAQKVLDKLQTVYSDKASADLISGLETLCNRGLALKQKYREITSYHPLTALDVPTDNGAWWEWNQCGTCGGRGVR